MTAESTVALLLAGLWALAGASSVSRPHLRLGNFFAFTCWLLSAVAAIGGMAAIATGRGDVATWPVAALSGAVITVRIRTLQRAAARASIEGRAALVLLGVGLAGAAAVTATAALTKLALDWPDRLGLVATTLLAVVAGLTTLVHITALHRERRSALGLLTGLGLAAAISGSAVAFVHLLIGALDTDRLGPGEAVLAAFVAVVAAVSVRPTVLSWVTRRVSRGRPDDKRLLDLVDGVVQRRLPLEETLLQVCELLRSSLLLEGVEVWTVAGDEVQLVASDPHRRPRSVALSPTARRIGAGAADSASGEWLLTWLPGVIDDAGAATVAVTYAGVLQGLVVAYGVVDELPSVRLEEVGHRLGPVMHSASLDASLSESVSTLRKREQALKASRERLVAAADSERARIERDLHDGAQQHLVALSVNLRLARGLLRSNPERAETLLDEMSVVTQRAVEELRSLSHGIFPKTLQDEGIGPALDEVARSHRNVAVRVVSNGVRRAPREVETAVYFACNEAITNAVKHAEATNVAVNLVADGANLVFEVLDDGCGFEPDRSDAHGLNNMADRIGAVDGELTITSDASGTRVLGSVPLPG